MKKRIIITVMIMMLLFASMASGSSVSYIGKKVNGQVDVKVNGEVIGQAVVIDGKSFIPVRDISNSINAGLSIEKGGTIKLETTKDNELQSSVEKIIQYNELKKQVEQQQKLVDNLEKSIEPTTDRVEELKKKYEDRLAEGVDNVSYKVQYQSAKKELEDKIARLPLEKDKLLKLQQELIEFKL